MSSISWHSLRALETIHQQIQASLSSLLKNTHESTLWLGTDGAGLISEIKIRETETSILLDIQLLEQLTDLDVQVSPETAVICARSYQDEVEGYFSTGQLQNIIPLPISVHPETVHAELQDTTLTLVLPKAGKIDRQRISLPVSTCPTTGAWQKSMVNL